MDTTGSASRAEGILPEAREGSEATAAAVRVAPPWAALSMLTVAVLLAMSLWFSASAVVSTLIRIWHISGLTASWMTASVQIGFVSGALVSATLGLPDLLNSRKLLVASCFAGALFNSLFVLVGRDIPLRLTLRFLTGVAIAGVYRSP